MTPMESILASRPIPASESVGRSVRVCWTSRACLNGHRIKRFVLTIELVSKQQGVMEAWIEHGDRASDRVCVCERQSVTAKTATNEGLLHIDVFESHGESRIAAISLVDCDDHRAVHPLYVWTSLLTKAGFLAGRYDPPTVNVNADSKASDRKRSG